MAMLAASCASKKAATDGATSTNLPQATTAKAERAAEASFVQRIYDQRATVRNIVASADVSLASAGKDISCDGKLSMRRDEIIRLQLLLPIIRTEVARVDFTPTYVLMVDRLHKEYIKASYDDVSFLADNGLSFYSLQALFWNQLFLPGEKSLAEQQLGKLVCSLATAEATATVKYQKGNIAYQWAADKATAQIKATDISYAAKQHGTSRLTWTYADFRAVGGKPFPMTQQLSVSTDATGSQKTAQLTIKASSPKTTADWDTTTELSSKYKRIEAQDILKKLLSIQ